MSKTLDLLSHEAFVARRRALRGLGASDIAKAAGLSPYGGPLDLYLEKVGLKPPIDTPQTRWGLKLEEAVAEAYAEATGRTVESPSPSTWTHPTEGWIFAHPDRFASGRDEPSRFVELKTARSEWDVVDDERKRVWGDEGTDQIPRGYYLQAQWQMLAAAGSQIDLVDVAVLIGGSDFRVYPIPANIEAQKLLWSIGFDLWQMIERRIPPDPDWSDPRTPELIGLLHRPAEGREIQLGEDEADLANMYHLASVDCREAERRRDEYKARLIERMGAAAVGLLPDGRRITRKLVPAAPPKMSSGRREYFTFTLSNFPKERP